MPRYVLNPLQLLNICNKKDKQEKYCRMVLTNKSMIWYNN